MGAPCDDFEDGTIDNALWDVGGNPDRGIGGGQWQFEHVEVNGYLGTHVFGPTSGNSHGAEAWVKTDFDYHNGQAHMINFEWGAQVNASHVDQYAIQITDGTIPDGTDVFWFGSSGGETDGTGWTNLYFRNGQPNQGPTQWSILIDPSTNSATLFDGPNLSGQVVSQKALPTAQAWFVRFILADATSSGFPAGDNWLYLYDYCSLSIMLMDTDADGVPDLLDNCLQVSNPNQFDTDGDDIGDVCDNCVDQFNPFQEDSDADEIGDLCDNCPLLDNPDQADCDGDGQGDACDDDDDNDGVLDVDDVCPCNGPGLSVDCEGRPRLDLNGDCQVDAADLQQIVNEFVNQG